MLSKHFGVRGIPSAALLNADGIVVWAGHPAELDNKTLEAALKGALKKPLFDAPSLEAALADAKSDAAMTARITALIDARVARVKAALEEGNLLYVRDAGGRLLKQLGKLDQAAGVKSMIDTLATVERSAEILTALESIAKIDVSKLKKKSEGEKALDELKRIVKELPETYAEKAARAKMDDLLRILPGLK